LIFAKKIVMTRFHFFQRKLSEQEVGRLKPTRGRPRPPGVDFMTIDFGLKVFGEIFILDLWTTKTPKPMCSHKHIR
jgi:hypothetical protein